MICETILLRSNIFKTVFDHLRGHALGVRAGHGRCQLNLRRSCVCSSFDFAFESRHFTAGTTGQPHREHAGRPFSRHGLRAFNLFPNQSAGNPS